MLNHFACVGLKRRHFSILCRGAASTALRCVPLLKKRPRGKVKCDSQSLLKVPIKSENNDSIGNFQVMLLTS